MTAKCVTAARKFDNAVRKTLLDSALLVANAVTDEWEDMTDVQAAELAGEVVADYPKGSATVRKSEWKAFFMAAHHGLADAIEYAGENVEGFNRIQLFKLCRILPTVRGFKKAVAQLTAKSNTPDKTPAQKFGMGLGIIKNVQTRSAKFIAFRKELAALCAKHGIKY